MPDQQTSDKAPNMEGIKGWQATYDWACAQPPEQEMDASFWWKSVLLNSIAVALTPIAALDWRARMLTELYAPLFTTQRLTVGQFKEVLERVKPEEENGPKE